MDDDVKVGINGMGRIGRLALRAAFGAIQRPIDDPRAANRLDLVHVNEIKAGAEAVAHLIEFDSVQGRWRADIRALDESSICIDHEKLIFSSISSPEDIPWGELGVDLVQIGRAHV